MWQEGGGSAKGWWEASSKVGARRIAKEWRLAKGQIEVENQRRNERERKRGKTAEKSAEPLGRATSLIEENLLFDPVAARLHRVGMTSHQLVTSHTTGPRTCPKHPVTSPSAYPFIIANHTCDDIPNLRYDIQCPTRPPGRRATTGWEPSTFLESPYDKRHSNRQQTLEYITKVTPIGNRH